MRQWFSGLLCAALGVAAIAAFHDAATLHGEYRHAREGIRSVPLPELVYLLWYGVWGGLAMLLLAHACYLLLGPRLTRVYEHCAQRPREVLVLLSLPVFALVLTLRQVVLRDQPVADDELVYELNARNLALGRLTGPPPLDPALLLNDFVIVDAQRWHGKYPIGHSVLLAPFELLGRPDLLGALLSLATLALTHAVARRFIGPRGALGAALLLAVSPHFLLTHATLLSQTTTTALTLCAVLAFFRFRETDRRRWLSVMGAALGLGVLTRPLPMLLVLVVLGAHCLSRNLSSRRRWLLETLAWVAPVAAFGVLFLTVNALQSGRALRSGYHEIHPSFGMFQNIAGELTNSVGSALVRANVWLLGWPCSLLFVPLARPRKHVRLFWAVILTALVYRVIVPKVVIGTTGPLYITEIVPWLCMASAAGIQRSVTWLRALGIQEARARLAGVVVAGLVVCVGAFVPIQWREISRGAAAREHVWNALAEHHATRALVFADLLLPVESGLSWSYDPPNPWPDLRDDILFLRIPTGQDGPRRMHELWLTRFADRPAYLYQPNNSGGQLYPLIAPKPSQPSVAASSSR